tara:strand:- start:1898 stop:2266 length:369 start_codon:yes stop_codon:yes gene_type:complete
MGNIWYAEDNGTEIIGVFLIRPLLNLNIELIKTIYMEYMNYFKNEHMNGNVVHEKIILSDIGILDVVTNLNKIVYILSMGKEYKHTTKTTVVGVPSKASYLIEVLLNKLPFVDREKLEFVYD